MPSYRIDATEPRTDGSGDVAYDVWALDDDGLVVPGKHSTILCPYAEVQAVLDAGSGPAQLAELKAMLIRNKAPGWDKDDLLLAIANNLNAAAVDEDFDVLVDSVGGYPYSFEL